MKNSREQEMFALIEASRQSGISNQEFISQRGLTMHTFYYWRRKYNQRHNSGNLIPVKTSRVSSATTIELYFHQGVRVVVSGIDAVTTVKALLGL